ncbi:MAG TPA: YjjG family noncanonical pyrimidine nucleotidase [Bacteroidales bacterium]|nr:YjjG family noncanonical pyrimidine nucleotidase [Bacteroidales bacterium]
MTYKNVFIDLDRTLWDFETNSKETLNEIFFNYDINKYCEFSKFYKTYRNINDDLWGKYRSNQITKEILSWKRFYLTNISFGYDDENVALKMGKDYISNSPYKTKLFPNTHEILKHLSERYNLYLITNGFKEVQYLKIKNCDIEKYFKKIFTSEEVGFSKPHIKYFEYVLESTCSTPKDSIVIGDDLEVDVKGAKQLNIDTIWFKNGDENQEGQSKYIIKSLQEIIEIL